MSIEIFLFLFKVLVIFVFCLAVLYIWLNWQSIDSFFHPEKYSIIDMLESDNNSRVWLQRKNKDLRFLFNDGWYNMFEATIDNIEKEKDLEEEKEAKIVSETADKKIKTPPPIPELLKFQKRGTSVYREGRLAKFYYKEGKRQENIYSGSRRAEWIL